MSDTTIMKVDSAHSPTGKHGETYLASGKSLAMRLWREQPGERSRNPRATTKPSAS
ncbi:MAG: hypothetical protein SFV54_20325 [Bryobacteraceae bacterium]|nr:hypothetical protein [Bryobacteraceae bacterium]